MPSAERFKRLMELFDDAVSRSESEQQRLLAEVTATDPTLAGELERMIRADAAPEAAAGSGARLLVQELAAEVAPGPDEATVRGPTDPPSQGRTPAIPVLSGEYRMIRLIGEGGMGAVYEAEQKVPRRRVAIKVVRSRFASRRLLQRFAHEAHILGRLHHPGIAQIHEAGAGDREQQDQAFLVMEFVDGATLTAFAEERGLDIAQRLELVAKVGDAVAHAHVRGVIHRDLKPANILVDSSGQPKVLDFGVARVTDGDHQLSTELTSLGQIVGTLPYMSPEQVTGDPNDVDVRSDVYALGVILYELLARRLPHDLSRRSIPDSARIIREQEPPRLSSLVRECRGDIETIVHKAIDKDKGRRYQAASELVDDLRRCCAGEPILARQHSTLYVVRKQLRRYQGAVAAAALALIAMAAFAIFAWRQSVASRESAAAAEAATAAAVAETRRAETLAGNLELELRSSRIERGRLLARSGSVRAAEGLVWPELFRDPGSAHAFYALCELAMHQPCTAAWWAGGGAIRSVEIRRSDDAIVCGLEPGRVAALDAEDGELLGRSGELGTAVWALGLLPDEAVAVADGSGFVAVVEPGTLALRWRQRGHDSARSLTVLHDGSFVTGGADHTLVRWSADGEVLASGKLPASVLTLATSPDGTMIAAGCGDGSGRLLDPSLGPGREIVPRGPFLIAGATFQGDGEVVYFTGGDRTIRACRVADGVQVAMVRRPNGTIRGVKLAPDGRSAISAGWWYFDLWRLPGLLLDRSYPMHEGATALAFLRDGHRAVVTHAEGVARIWELDQRWPRMPVASGTGPTASCVHAQARLIAWGDESGHVALHDATDGRVLRTMAAASARVATLAFDDAGERLAGVSRDGTMHVWSVADGSILATRTGVNSATVRAIAFAPDGTRIAAAHRNNRFSMLDVETLKPVVVVTDTREPLSVAVLPDGRSFIGASREPIIHRWALDGAALNTYSCASVPWSVAVSADGRTLAVGTWGKTVELFDVITGAPLGALEGHSAVVNDVRFLIDDPNRLVSGGSDGEVRLWDVSARRALLAFGATSGWEIHSVAHLPGLDRIVVSDASGDVSMWDLRAVKRSVASTLEHALRRSGRAPDDPPTAPLRDWARAVIHGEPIEGPWERPASPEGMPTLPGDGVSGPPRPTVIAEP